MVRIRCYSLFVIVIIAVLTGGASFALAEEVNSGLLPCSGIEGVESSVEFSNLKPCTACDFFGLITKGMDFITRILIPPLAVILLAYAGLLYLVSGAVDKRVQANRLIFGTVVGVAFIYSSFILFYTLLMTLSGDAVTAEKYFKITARGFALSCDTARAPGSS